MLTAAAPFIIGLALGSNLGDRRQHLCAGLSLLRQRVPDLCIRAIGGLYETAPVDCAPGTQSFYNSVAEVSSRLPIEDFHRHLQAIEQALGRPAERARNAPRPLDLDILYVDELVLDTERLTLPHPRMGQRRFVLRPLADIRPDLVLPGQGAPVMTLLQHLAGQEADIQLIQKNWYAELHGTASCPA
jgi:2-amino-4-hydroxy-6-hydroxymethyldihydropteridine diphosphokinase